MNNSETAASANGPIDEAFVNQMREAVEKTNREASNEPAFKWAAMRTEFSLQQMAQELPKISTNTLSEEMQEILLENCTHKKLKDTYSLNNNIRTQVLSRMPPTTIQSYVAIMEVNEDDWQQLLLCRLLRGEIKDASQLQEKEYVQAYTFLEWLQHKDLVLPSRPGLLKLIRRQDLVKPFRRLTEHFQGRVAELEKIGAFVSAITERNNGEQNGENFMYITGVGGVGKSTLVAKAVLDHLTNPAYAEMPFVHLDFDNPGFSVAEIFNLIKEGLSQLALQKGRYEPRLKETIDWINGEFLQSKYNSNVSRESDRSRFYGEVFREGEREMLQSFRLPLLLVLDSFEELQYRSSPSEIDTFFQFLHELKQFLPTLKVIFVGRAEIVALVEQRPQDIYLDAFELGSAVSFLARLGITDHALGETMFEKLGGNPLTLQLAANLTLNQLGDADITLEAVNHLRIFEKIDSQLVQQQLVTRNLDHIHNKEVAAIAVPGLLLRKINAEIIQQVLAEVCGLGAIDNLKAEELFEQLKKESFLLKQTNEGVEFRKDLRVSLHEMILKEAKYKALQVHNAAVVYYENEKRQSPADKAEYLFHCLQRGNDVSVIAKVYVPEMKIFMEQALSELQPEAREELARAMGIGIKVKGIQKMTLDRWELHTMSRIQNILEIGDEKQLIEIRGVLDERTERTGNAAFLLHEKMVRMRLMEIKPGMVTVANNAVLSKNSDKQSLLQLNVLSSQEQEYQQQFEAAFNILKEEDHLNINDLVTTSEGLAIAFNFFITRSRLDARQNQRNTMEATAAFIESIYNLATKPTRVTSTYFYQLIPKIYRIPLQENYRTEHQIGQNEKYSTEEFLEVSQLYSFTNWFIKEDKWMRGDEFTEHFNFLKTNIKTNAELERYARRTYKVQLKDICLPGSLDVCLYDFLLFAEAMPRSTEKLELPRLSAKEDFADKRNMVQAEDFINMPNVIACVEKLQTTFSSDGKRQLLVSDILDEEGHQYVNLVQGGKGVHHIAVLGYTYILEKMGIRFLKIAGTNTGAVNTALLGMAGAKKEEHTRQVLDHITSLDYYALVDGNRLSKWLFKFLGNTQSVSKSISRTFAIVFMLSIFITVITATTIFSLRTSDSFWAILLTTFGIYALFMFSVVRVWRIVSGMLKFGGGLNPGTYLQHWMASVFATNEIKTSDDLIKRVSATPKLVSRNEAGFDADILQGEIAFVCADVITQSKIILPRMANLFWRSSDIDLVDPAIFVRAATSIPLFYNACMVTNIPVSDEGIKQAWEDTFGEYEPPKNACLVDGGVFGEFPISIFQDGYAPLPTFGVDTMAATENINSKDILKMGWLEYVKRLMTTGNLEQTLHDKTLQKAICNIKIDQISWLNFNLTDKDKLELFSLGAKAATDFLLQFDWEQYKKSTGNRQGYLSL